MPLVCCSPQSPVRMAARLMRENNVGAVLICEGGVPVGIITDRDLVVRCVTENLDPDQSLAQDVMTRHVEVATPNETLRDVIQHMKGEEIRRVAIVDHDGKAVGLLSFGDVCSILAQELNDLSAA